MPGGEPKDSTARRLISSTLVIIVALTAITVLVYAPVRQFDFVELDDPAYVKENPHVVGGLTLDNVTWAFGNTHAAYWLPLTWISYMADVDVFGGVDAGGHHVTNLLLHIANTLLLFGFFRRATGAPGRSAFVAALFAVHPLHVESVAWITERKDVLSTLFWMLTLWAYLGYTRSPGPWRYALVAASIALGLMAKPMLVTLPFVLLLVDAWPLDRAARRAGSAWSRWKPLVVEKLPLLVLTIAGSVVAVLAQAGGGAAPTLESLPVALRLQNAVVSYAAYLGQAVWPSGLVVFYPFPPSIPAATVLGALLLLVCVTAVVVRLGRGAPYLPVGWFWYLGTLVPVIGLVQVGLQARADRFTYVPLVGIFVMVAWGIWAIAGRSRAAKTAVIVAGILVVGASAVQARVQVGYWRDSVALWTRAVERTLGFDAFQAHEALGRVLTSQGRLDEALGHRREAVRLRPTSAEARAELGLLLSRMGLSGEAMAEYEEAVRLNPSLSEVRNNLGVLLAQQGRFDAAVEQFAAAVRQNPDFETARVNLGLALGKTGRFDEALEQFRAVLARNPQHAAARRAVEELSRR